MHEIRICGTIGDGQACNVGSVQKKGAWVMSDMYELQAIKVIKDNLPIAVEEPTNPVNMRARH